MGVFNALFGAASLPASLREGMADYNLVKCYVLLHDLTTGPADGQAATDGLQAAPPAVCSPPPLSMHGHCTRHSGSNPLPTPHFAPTSAARTHVRVLTRPSAPRALATFVPQPPSTSPRPCSPPSPPQEISRAYGPAACKLLPINSRAADAPPLPDLWTSARPPDFNPTADAPPLPAAAEQLGALLSDADMEQACKPTPSPRHRPRPRPRPQHRHRHRHRP